MRVLVTGATGYIGGTVAAALKAAGHTVLALSRTDIGAIQLEAEGYTVRRGDITQPETIAAAAQGADGAIHTAATTDASRAAADQATAEVLLTAFAGTGAPVIYTSGMWDYGPSNGILTEKSPIGATPSFITWRPAFVDHFLKSGQEKGVRSIVIRPGMVYGGDDRRGVFANLIHQTQQNDGVTPFIGDGTNHWTLVSVEDLTHLYVLALEKAPAGSLYLGVHGHALTVRQIAEAANRTVGGTGETKSVSLEMARSYLGPIADALVMDQQASGEKAQRELGWNPHAPSLLKELSPSGSYAALVV